jgi:hypothetical protein
VWTIAQNLAPTGTQSRSESLCRLSYSNPRTEITLPFRFGYKDIIPPDDGWKQGRNMSQKKKGMLSVQDAFVRKIKTGTEHNNDDDNTDDDNTNNNNNYNYKRKPQNAYMPNTFSVLSLL